MLVVLGMNGVEVDRHVLVLWENEATGSGKVFKYRNNLVGWSSDSGSQGTGFDSRLAQVIFGSLFGDFWDVLGCVWEWFGDVFGWI